MSDQAIVFKQQGYVATLGLNNPPMNPLGAAQVAALEKLLAELAVDKTVRVIVIKGEGNKHFCVGANLKEADLAADDPKAFVQRRLQLFNQLAALEKPVIAAIQGYCLGGGLELAMACHFRIADTSASLGLPEVNLGVAPLWGGVSRLLRLAGQPRALDLLLSGRKLNADEALAINLLSQQVAADSFDAEVHTFAEMLAAKPPLAVAAMLRVITQSQDLPLATALDIELDELSPLTGTKDNIEGVTALFEKRQPVFIGE